MKLGTTPCPVCRRPLAIATRTPRQTEPGWLAVTLTFTDESSAHLRTHYRRRRPSLRRPAARRRSTHPE